MRNRRTDKSRTPQEQRQDLSKYREQKQDLTG